MKAIAKIAAIAAVLLVIPALAQEKSDEELRREYEGVPWEKAHKVEGEHYKVRTNASEEVAKRYSGVLEKLVELYGETFPEVEAREMKWEAWIYKTKREFVEKHASRAKVTAGFYFPGDRRIYTYHGLFGVSGSTFGILAHEGVHAFQHAFLKSYYDTPVWLLEGMAVMFEGVEVKDDGELVLEEPPRDRFVQVKVELKDREAMSLSEVVGRDAKPISRRSYAYAGMFLWWLAKGKGPQRKVLTELLETLQKRSYREDDLEVLLERHLGKSLSAVEREWESWVRREKVEYTGREISGGTYTSKLLGFTIKRPDTDWVMDGSRAPVDGECIVYRKSSTGGRISVTVYSNQLPLRADELYMQRLDEMKDEVRELEIEHRERKKLKGEDGFLIRYEGSEPGSGITGQKQKVELRVVVGRRRIYVVRMQSSPGKWERNARDFDRAFERFRLID